MRFSNIKRGNIVLDVSLIKPEDLSMPLIKEAYEVPTGNAGTEQLSKLLASARDRGLLGFELNSSHGATGAALLRTVDIHPGHLMA